MLKIRRSFFYNFLFARSLMDIILIVRLIIRGTKEKNYAVLK